MQGAARTVPEHTDPYVRNGSAAATQQMAPSQGIRGLFLTKPYPMLCLAVTMPKDQRRKERKTFIYEDIELYFPDDSTRVQANALDISLGGIGLLCPKRLLINRDVIIKIGLLSDNHILQYESVSGTVVWCRSREFGFAIGIKFKNLNPTQHPQLVEFLDQMENTRETVRPMNTSDYLEE